MKNKKKRKALVLLSGGLDSLLAAKLLMEQSIEVTGLVFKSYFFDDSTAKKAAKQLGLPLKTIDFSDEHLELIKNPPRGYGKAANPCIDCHLLMLKRAYEILKREKFDFVATGEVIGERPFSQNKQAMVLIARESGLNDLLLRPLSAKILSPTLPEENGWVNRDKLMNIKGRSRQKQIALAKKYQLDYPQPGGGCLLCEPEFAKKLFDLLKKKPDCQGKDVILLKLGRHFWDNHNKIVLGKNEEENNQLEKLAQKGDVLIKPQNFPGPTVFIRGKKITQNSIKNAKMLIIKHSKKTSVTGTFSTSRV